jgi:hypothetical protein
MEVCEPCTFCRLELFRLADGATELQWYEVEVDVGVMAKVVEGVC